MSKSMIFDPSQHPNSSAVQAMLAEKHPRDVAQILNIDWSGCVVSYELVPRAQPKSEATA